MTARPIAVPLRTGARGYVAVCANIQQEVRESLNQIVFVNPGERFMRNDIGVPLLSYVFHPVDDVFVAAIENYVRAQVERYEPRASVDQVRAWREEAQDGSIVVYLEIAYEIPSINRLDTTTISSVFTRGAR